LSQLEIMGLFRKELNKIPKTEAFIQDLSTMGFSAQRGFPVEFSVRGRNWDKLAEVSSAIMDRMKKSPYFMDVDTDYLLNVPEVQIRPDRRKAQARGTNMEDIGKAVNALIGGSASGSIRGTDAGTMSAFVFFRTSV